ncbi:spore germination protein [Paenactinomyces guangxiensis]
MIGHNSDVNIREFIIGRTNTRAALIFIDGLADKDLIDKHIMKSLMLDLSEAYKQEQTPGKDAGLKEFIKNHVLSVGVIQEVHTLQDLISEVLTGATALIIDGSSEVIILFLPLRFPSMEPGLPFGGFALSPCFSPLCWVCTG